MALQTFFGIGLSKSHGTCIDWNESHGPSSCDRCGHLCEVATDIKGWWTGNAPVCSLEGPNGSGKTKLLSLALKEEGVGVITFDFLATRIKIMLEEVHQIQTINAPNTCIVIDNVDISAKALIAMIKTVYYTKNEPPSTRVKIAVISNNTYGSLSNLPSAVYRIHFPPAPVEYLVSLGGAIIEREGKRVQGSTLETIAQSSLGDMRFFVNQLRLASASDSTFNHETRLQHQSVFDVCKQMLFGSDIDLNDTSSFINTDAPTVAAMLFENNPILTKDIHACAEVTHAVTDFDIVDRSKAFGTLPLKETLAFRVSKLVTKQPIKTPNIKYPALYSKTFLSNTYMSMRRAVTTQMYTKGMHTLPTVEGVLWLVRACVDAGDKETFAALCEAHHITSDMLVKLARLNNLDKWNPTMQWKRVCSPPPG